MRLQLKSIICLCLAIFCLHTSPHTADAAKKGNGFRFPSFKVTYFQYKQKQKYYRKVFNFASVIGKKPVVMFYFLPQHAPSITELKVFAATSKVFKDSVQFFAVTKAQTRKEAQAAYKKMKELKIDIPVLLDEKGLMAYVMLTRRVPSYAVVTRSGYLRLARASQLTETIAPGVSLLQFITKVSKGKEPPFARALGYSPNPYDLIGKKAPSLTGKYALKDGKGSLSGMLKKKKPALVVFWSVTCPHCQATLPPLCKYAKKKKAFDMLGVVRTDKKQLKNMLKALVKKHTPMQAMTMLSPEKPTSTAEYRVMSVPTLFLVDTKGVIRAVNVGGGKHIQPIIDRMLESLKKPKSKS